MLIQRLSEIFVAGLQFLERATLRQYYNLLALVVDRSVWLEGYAREQITLEEQHIAEVDKMMRRPGALHPTG